MDNFTGYCAYWENLMGEAIPKGLIGRPRFDFERRRILFDFWCLGRRQSGCVQVTSQVLPDVAIALFEAVWPKIWFGAVCKRSASDIKELDFTI
jgi:hypothetical protein